MTPGRVAILAPETLLSVLSEALAAADLPVVDARDMRKGGLSEPLVLLAADSANGLEFDSVVVVEPGVIAGETARGLRTLYVALTRPTQRLSVVHLAPCRPPSTATPGRLLTGTGHRAAARPGPAGPLPPVDGRTVAVGGAGDRLRGPGPSWPRRAEFD